MPTEPRTRAQLAPLSWLLFAGACAGVLVVAAWLEPDPRGYGTHAQLGLPPCGFHFLTGLACPGCGLTTAFAHSIRGDFAAAFSSNPLGPVLFAAVCACIPVALVASVRGWSLGAAFDRLRLDRWALAVAASALVAWFGRLADVL